MKKKLVLIGDIEDSQSVKNKEREALQKSLTEVLENINDEGGNGILSPYTVTLGDEFQAVFNRTDGVFVQMLKIMATVHPIGVRFSLAVGSIDTAINKEQAIGMDGPAFHLARQGIERLKESGYLFNIVVQDKELTEIKIINNSLQLLSGRIRSWNKRRLLILQMIKEGYGYKEISEAVGISHPAFYKNKESGMLDVVDELSDNITILINQYLEV